MARPSTETVERGVHCQGHRGIQDGQEGPGVILWTWEPKKVAGQGGVHSITWRAPMECSCEHESRSRLPARSAQSCRLGASANASFLPSPHVEDLPGQYASPFSNRKGGRILLWVCYSIPLVPGDRHMAPAWPVTGWLREGSVIKACPVSISPGPSAGTLETNFFPPLRRRFNYCKAGRVMANNS